MPRVSIGMPVYNGEKFIRQAVESLLAQTFGDLELVISDNASTDGTEALCRELERLDPRVRYSRSEQNLGGPGNFRRVFHLCHGEYHKWSTADDYWDPTVVERCVAILDARPDVVLAYPKTRLEDEHGRLLREYDDDLDLTQASPAARMRRVLEGTTLCHAHLGVIRRAAMSRTGLIGSELASDIRFLAELSLYGQFVVVPEYLFHRRFHEQSSSWDRASVEHQRKYYDPERRTSFGMHTWRRMAHLAAGVGRAPIPLREKLIAWGYLGRRASWERRRLWQELKAAAHGPG